MEPTKKELRQYIRDEKKKHTNRELIALSESIIDKLLHTDAIDRARCILMYYSLPDEVYTHEAVDLLLQMGKMVLLPKVIDGENMEVRIYTGSYSLQKGSFNIMEPAGELFTDFEKIDVAVVPGMAFDDKGNRLGRGKGYYDRFLRLLPRARKIGISFPFQKLPSIPTESTDTPMDEVL